VIILGLILVLAAIAAGILLFEGTSRLTDGVDIDIIGGGTISLPPLALLITGAAVISVFWLGWALLRHGMKRGARRRRAAKEEAALTEQRRVENERKMQEEFAQRERQITEERRRHEEETSTLRRESDARVEEQHLSTEEARRRAEIAEAQARSNTGDAPRNDPRNDPRV
jgi:membrane protein involved in colicin uptake